MFSHLAEHLTKQYVYIPVKKYSSANKHLLLHNDVTLKYDPIVHKIHKVAYFSKIKKQLRGIETFMQNNILNVDLVHAHSLFTDGGTAYLLKKKYGVKYTVSIRSTDINHFFKKAKHLRPFIYKVLKEAEKIYFISPAYKEKSSKYFPSNINNIVNDKSGILPNGISEAWLLDNKREMNEYQEPTVLFFTGALTKRKNLITILKAMKKSEEDNLFLKVAGNGPQLKKIKKFIKRNDLENHVELLGYLSEDELKTAMHSADLFILPSIKETFGISYIEAMSRGLPIIYTKNEGVDGIFPKGHVGYSVNPYSTIEILKAIRLIKSNYSTLSKNAIKKSRHFDWGSISSNLKEDYTNIINR